MQIARRFTTAGRDPTKPSVSAPPRARFATPTARSSSRPRDVEVPAEWSQVACDILAQKYLRKAGVPARLAAVEEDGVPPWLWRRAADAAALAALPKAERSGGETSAKQCFDRLAGTWTYWGWKGGYFDAESGCARLLRRDRGVMLARQMGAPNSPQWFNTGLYWAYGIDGPAQGHYYVDHRTGKVRASDSAYEHPQPHACFIQSVADDLVNEGGIMDLWVREARLFKYGSGTGSNFSKLRGDGERLSGGGRSSGLMSFLKIGDRAAGAIKSGGTTRRAAKMVIVDADHPDIEQFIDWKVVEEQKVAALVAGSKLAARHLNRIMAACRERTSRRPVRPGEEPGAEARDPRRAARDDPGKLHPARHPAARQGFTAIDFRTYDTDWESEAYVTVAGQNSNNTVRVANDFLERVESGGDWQLIRRTDGAVTKTMPARELWDQHRARRLGLGRSRAAIRHDDQRLAHLPGERPHQRLEPVLGVHVSRRHGVQSRLAEPAGVPRERGRQLRGRGFPARGAAVDDRARNLGHDGAVPVARDRAAQLRLPHLGPRLRQSRRALDGLGHPL